MKHTISIITIKVFVIFLTNKEGLINGSYQNPNIINQNSNNLMNNALPNNYILPLINNQNQTTNLVRNNPNGNQYPIIPKTPFNNYNQNISVQQELCKIKF